MKKILFAAIRAVRLEKAQQLLQQPQMKLDAVANFCGYKSAAAFSVFYKTETGHTCRMKNGGKHDGRTTVGGHGKS